MNGIKLFGLLAGMSALAACSNEKTLPEPSFGRVPISMSANVNTIFGRAEVSTFPNAVSDAAQVAIVARKTSAADWSTLYFSGAIANVGAAASGYSLAWAAGHDKYWPSNGDGLTLVAYSPISVGTAGTLLNIALSPSTPDVIVAHTKDGTSPVTGMKSGSGQTPSSINFLFEHILGQLTVKVNNTSSSFQVTKVEIAVGKNNCVKTYDVGTRAWAAGIAPASDEKYTYTKITGFGNGSTQTVNTNPLLLFPGTESDIQINIYQGADLLASRKINEFLDAEDAPASIVAGKRTTLILTVSDAAMSALAAGVQGWEELGEFGSAV